VAACLSEVIAFSYTSSFSLYGELAECFDASAGTLPYFERAERSVFLLRRFLASVGCTVRFSDFGFKESDIDKAVEVAFKGYYDNIQNFARVATREQVRDLYAKCL
jgi:alcohol dehydrogenase class IV